MHLVRLPCRTVQYLLESLKEIAHEGAAVTFHADVAAEHWKDGLWYNTRKKH